ncbi:hypothetical protein R9C00_16985 [Flammeovirgaceae bacterium SG7u.111]|nr:hypothetical protein [Flammeovirgaceae bacterium SG7u.132]WPO33396.1 hypothetical protein R9C00_16985 [Flammeovirgaceae bacterium SG7u.111]
MKITKELLDRYVAGFSTPEEQELIKEWLESTDTGINDQLAALDVDSLQQDVWDNVVGKYPELGQGLDVQESKNNWTFIKYAASIVLVVFMTGIVVMKIASNKKHYLTNNSTERKAYAGITSMEVFLTANSSAHISSQWQGKPKSVSLCGDMILKPTENLKISFESSCTGRKAKKKIKNCLKDKTYLGMTHDFIGGGIVVVDTKRLHRLPLRLEGMAYMKLNEQPD